MDVVVKAVEAVADAATVAVVEALAVAAVTAKDVLAAADVAVDLAATATLPPGLRKPAKDAKPA